VLAELNIRNFALIERQRIPLGPGLNVISGETGAGKSLVVDALKFVLGARAAQDVIRAGEQEAQVEALFYVDAAAERARIAALLPDIAGIEEAGELVLSRTIQRGSGQPGSAGRSRATVNGRLVPVAQLQELADRLVEVCGQHDTQALFRAAEQREIVDQFGGLERKREAFGRCYEARRAAAERLEALESGARDRAARREALEFQTRELGALAVHAGELDELERELARLENAAKVRAALRAAHLGIYESEAAVLAKLAAISRELEAARAAVPELAKVTAAIDEGARILEDAALTCRDLRASFRTDDDRREQVSERIGAIRRAALRYGRDADRLAALLPELERELAALDGSAGDAAALRAEVARLDGELAAKGRELTDGRRKAGERLAREVGRELASLGMQGARLSVELTLDPAGAGPCGLDRVELLIRTNAGEEAKPLRKIASGGEASRVMLALKARLAGEGSVPTLVFDEVDANVGGRLGTTIGEKLRELGRRYQVLCVTHLPQIASFAEHHLTVSKATEGGRTFAAIAALDPAARLREIAHMIRGDELTEVTMAEAREMVESARAGAAQAERGAGT
jgi:DNA repair protein RecN (Recombination protein N)